MASDMIETEPITIPTITLNKTRKELEATDSIATFSFFCWIVVIGITPDL